MKNCDCTGCQCLECTAYGECDTCYECAYSDNKSIKIWCNIRTLADDKNQYITEQEATITDIEEEPIIEIVPPHKICHNFAVLGDSCVKIYCDIIKALKKARNNESDLYCEERGNCDIVYSSLGLSVDDNNDLLSEYGVFYNEDNVLVIK